MTVKETPSKPLHSGGPVFHPVLGTLFDRVEFPQDRKTIIRYALENNAGRNVIERLERMPDATYKSMEDFRRAFGEVIEDYGATGRLDETTG